MSYTPVPTGGIEPPHDGRHAEGVLRHDDPLPSHLAKPA